MPQIEKPIGRYYKKLSLIIGDSDEEKHIALAVEKEEDRFCPEVSI